MEMRDGILEFTTNYRSHRDIVAAVGRWMDTAADWDDERQPFRYGKDILPKATGTHPDYPTVISAQGIDAHDEARQLGDLLRFLRSSGVIAGYDQAVLLLHSVKDAVSGPYPDGLDAVGIPALCKATGNVGDLRTARWW